MAENKRTYTITINGLTESYESVKSLREALSGLTDTVINVSNEEQKTSETRKSTASSTDALAKAQEKLNNYDRAYQEELAKVNAELSANKKEINDALKLQQAQDIVDAKQLDTYAQKQQYLSALNTLIRNHSTATEEDVQAVDRMVQESAQLQAELKATDEQMQIHVRNVGNYNEAADRVVDANQSLKSELKSVTAQMADMLYNGVSQSDKAFVELAKKSGELKDAWQDAQEAVKRYSSDTRTMDNIINMATSAVNAYQLYNSTLVLFGKENEDAAESMQKMMAIMTVLNSLQQVQNSLLENGTATARLYHKGLDLIRAALGLKKKATEEDKVATEGSTKANNLNQVSEEKDAAAKKLNAGAAKTEKTALDQSTLSTQKDTVQKGLNEKATNKMSVAQRVGAVASKTLSTALRAIPLMFIIGLVVELISRWEEIWDWLRKTFPVLDKIGKKFDEMGGFVNAAKGYLIGLVDFIKNSVIATIEGLWNLLVDFFSDWSKLSEDWDKMGQEIGQARNNAIKKANDEIQEGITEKQNEEQLKRLNQQKDYLDIEEQNNKRYSKKYRKLIEDKYKVERELAKGNADKLHEIDVQYARDKAEIRNRDLKADEEAAKARKDAAEKAAQEWEKYKKKIDDLISASEEARLDVYKNVNRKAVDAANKAQLERLKQDAERMVKDTIEIVNDNFRKDSEETADLSKGINRMLLNDFAQMMSKRRLIVANQLAFEASEEKMAAEKRIEAAQKQIEQNEKILKTNKGKMAKYREEELKNENDMLREEIRLTETSLQTLFAKYAKNPINLPISIDVDGMYSSFREMYAGLSMLQGDLYEDLSNETDKTQKQLIQNRIDYAHAQQKIMKLWNPDSIIDGLLGTEDAFNDVEAKVVEYYYSLDEKTRKNIDLNTLLLNVFEQMGQVAGMSTKQVNEMRGEIVGLIDEYGEIAPEKMLGTVQKFFSRLQDLNVFAAKQKIFWEDDEEGLKNYLESLSLLDPIIEEGSVRIKEFGDLSFDMMEKLKGVDKELDEDLKKLANGYIQMATDIIAQQERIIKDFQEKSKDIKFEPVTDHSKYYNSHIIKLKETKENYTKLRNTYETYLASIQEGSEEMQLWEKAWQTKLGNTKFLYGEDSEQYKKMQAEKEQADKSYVLARQKTQEQLQDLTDKENKLEKDYWDGLADRMNEIYNIFNDNVMQPIQDGLGALFDFELEELQEALDEIEDMLDKAVDAREDSADRMKEINAELREDDGANKEALQQRLAEEEVLLVQREEAERALEKEREKRKRAVERKEAQQRVLELTQKLAEGIANTAVGVTAALKYGPILGPIFAAIIGAMGAVQTGIILKQIDKAKSKMAAGGKVGEDGVSRSHKQGGHRIEDTNIEVEGGEWVINKASSKKYDSLLKSINDDNVGLVRKQIEIIREKRIVERPNRIALMADGGQINTLAATRAVKENNEIAAISELIKQIDFQPTVSVVDINKVNKKLVRVQDYAGKAV